MNSKIYRQADSRWGSLPYPTKNYTFAHNGCGCCACTHNIIEIPKYANYTPADVRPYMVGQGFATKGHGTTWNGITKTLEHYGFEVATPSISSSMASAWTILNRNGAPKQGVLLFKAGVRGGIRWTSGGHYVAFLNYKVQNGKHYFYTKDSGGRHHDGWYCYETQMRGLLPKIWIVTKSPATTPTVTKPTGKYSGSIPSPTLKNGSKGTEVKKLQSFLNWYHPAWKLATDSKLGPKTEAALKSFQKTEGITDDGIYGKISQGKAKNYSPSLTPKVAKLIAQMDKLAWPYGTAKSKYSYEKGAPTAACKTAMSKYGYSTKAKLSDCGNFVTTVVREAGIDKNFKALHAVKTAFPTKEDKFDIIFKGKAIPSGLLKPGDIIRYKKTSGQHAMFYYGDGKVCDAGHYDRFANIRADEKRYAGSKVKKATIQVLRVKE